MYDLIELIDRVKKNDMLAMKILYQNSAPAMLNLSMRITQSKEESEDILQECYLRSFQKIHTLDDPKRYYSWLKRIVVNDSITSNKRKKYYINIDDTTGGFSDSDDKNWYEGIPFNEIKKAIDQLPNGSREVFTLYLLEGYKHREISESLNISESTSKSQYRYALKLLKEKLTHLRRMNTE